MGVVEHFKGNPTRHCPQPVANLEAVISLFAISFSSSHQENPLDTAKIFWSGRSQAVRLPKNFRFKEQEVRIRRHGNAVILEPLAKNWNWLDAISGALDQDFVQAAGEQPAQQERPGLDELFK